MTIPFDFSNRMRVPVIMAPMFRVSNPQMTVAACRSGVVGSFPSHNPRTSEELEAWLLETTQALNAAHEAGESPAPYAVNLVLHAGNPRLQADLDLIVKYRVPIVLTSKGAPHDVIETIHSYGGVAFHDVASARHAEKAAAAGADALIAVAGGAGGHCGTINPFALVNEIREVTDKPIILAGGMSSGQDVLSAEAMGASMAYMGTRFIATTESLASQEYLDSLIEGKATDILTSSALDGSPVNWYAPSLLKAGFNLDDLVTAKGKAATSETQSKMRYAGIWTAGHGIGATKNVVSVAAICQQLTSEYTAAKTKFLERVA